MKKQVYISPTARVVEIKYQRQLLLTASLDRFSRTIDDGEEYLD